MLSAYRCMNHIENVKNSNYLFWLELLELDERFNNPNVDEWFNNPNGKFDIVTNT
ncbi:hypothetical protein J6T66_04885 [bacterium]|nr:hypothetical protein [bacterium]